MLKKQFQNGWTQVPNQIINHKELSFKAKGLWMYINSKPEGWDFAVWRITKETREGEKAIRAGLNELVQFGYLEYKPKYDHDKKQFVGQEYILFDQSTLKAEYTETRVSQNGVHYNNKELNKKELEKNNKDTPQQKIYNLLEKLKIPSEDPIAYQIHKAIENKIPANIMDEYFDWLVKNKINHQDRFKPIAVSNWFYTDFLAEKAQKKAKDNIVEDLKIETAEIIEEFDTWQTPSQQAIEIFKKARQAVKTATYD